jgi:TfoX/Sxy family transcriptional regulator of competence genes
MFGYPCAFVNRNMFAGVHQDSVFVRLGGEGRERPRALGAARASEPLRAPKALRSSKALRASTALRGSQPLRSFEPLPGRVMREYVVVPETVAGRPAELAAWMKAAFNRAAALPAKRPRARRATKAGPSRARRPTGSRTRLRRSRGS